MLRKRRPEKVELTYFICSRNLNGEIVHESTNSWKTAEMVFNGYVRLKRDCLVTNGMEVLLENIGGRVSKKPRPVAMGGI